MRSKIFTPLNVGAFALQHRVGLQRSFPIDLTGVAESLTVDSSRFDLAGGIVIFDVGPIVSRMHLPQMPDQPEQFKSVCRAVMDNARSSRQSTVALLCGGLSCQEPDQIAGILGLTQREIGVIIDDYADAAVGAASNGFDGVELDASFGSTAHQFLMSSTNHRLDRYGGAIVQRMNFVMELVEALSQAVGRDRVGIRLSPFSNGSSGWRSDIYDELLRALHDQEIAYVHLAVEAHMDAAFLGTSQYTRALRRAYPGIFIVTGKPDLHFASEVVESRWADAVCFPGSDAALLGRLQGLRNQ